MKEPMNDLVRFIVDTQYDAIPLEVVTHVKKLILDTLAIMIAGSSQEIIPGIVDLVRDVT